MAKKYTFNETKKEYRTHVWDGTFNADGSKHRKTLISKKSSKDLERKVEQFKLEVENEKATRYTSSDFYEYSKEWLKLAKATREYNTRNMYDNIVNKHLVSLQGVPLPFIAHSHFQSLINDNIDKPRICEQIYITFRQIIRRACRDRIIEKSSFEDICDDIELPKRPPSKKRPLTPLEKEAVLNVEMEDRKYVFLMILYSCGLRRGEMLALTRDSFDFDNNTLSVKNVMIFEKETPKLKPYPKTDRGIRTVPIPDDIADRIRPFIESSDGFIFKSSKGGPLTKSGYDALWRSIIVNLNYAVGWKNKGEKLITGLTAHIFRHNYCTELCYKVPIISTKMIARLLGDTEKMVIEVYSHIIEEKEEPQDVVNEVFHSLILVNFRPQKPTFDLKMV